MEQPSNPSERLVKQVLHSHTDLWKSQHECKFFPLGGSGPK